MNLMLAVVYDAFTKIEKDKFRRLFLHKRKAAQHAFKLLVTQERPEQVSFQHLEGLLTAYRPTTSKKRKNICTFFKCQSNDDFIFFLNNFLCFFLAPTEAYLIFKLINKSESGYLSLDEFYGKLMHVVLEILATEEAFCLFFSGKLNNIFSEFFCPSFI